MSAFSPLSACSRRFLQNIPIPWLLGEGKWHGVGRGGTVLGRGWYWTLVFFLQNTEENGERLVARYSARGDTVFGRPVLGGFTV